MQIEIEKIIINLLKNYLKLPDNYGFDSKGNEIPTIVIRGQNVKLFNTDKMQITVSTLSSKVYANRKVITATDDDKFQETVYMNDQRMMQIDVYSRNNEARQRYPEVQMALTSTLAEQLQDKYQFKLGKIGLANNLTGLVGGSDVNRYTIRFNCLCWYQKTTDIDYYDKFEVTAQTENGQSADIKINK